jgi:hypothetical protein
MRHYVVAIDEVGDHIHNIYFPAEMGARCCWTADHSTAMKVCGEMMSAWTKGATIGTKKVGGFEVVSEQGEAPLNDLPMLTVLEPTGPAIVPTEDTWEGAAFNEDGTWERDWDIFGICGVAGENLFNDQVLEQLEKLELEVIEDPTGCPFAIEDIADTETKRGWEDFLPEALALGLRLAKVPDEMDSPYYRWYVVKP